MGNGKGQGGMWLVVQQQAVGKSLKIISGIKTKARVILLASSTSKLSLLGHAGSKVFPRGRLFG